MQIALAEYAPDSAAFDTPFTAVANNVLPVDGGFGPMLGATITIGEIPTDERCCGIVEVEHNGIIYRFMGSETKLWLYDFTLKEWNDVSGVSAPYGAGVTTQWSFVQYGSYFIAANGFDLPQRFIMGDSARFKDLKGDPPAGAVLKVHKEFTFTYTIEPDGTSVVWNSAIGNPELWDGTFLSDAQPIPEGGPGTGLEVGETVLFFQETKIHRFIFTGDPNAPFQREEISTGRGAVGSNCVRASGGRVYFLARDGFYSVGFGGDIKPIGAGRINKLFFRICDPTEINRTKVWSDPNESRVYFLFKTGDTGQDNVYDRQLIYDWRLDKWSIGDGFIAQDMWDTIQQGVTLENFPGNCTGSVPLESVSGSFDDQIYRTSGVLRALVDERGRMRTFGGDNLEAVFETAPMLSAVSRIAFTGIYPVINTNNVRAHIGTQEFPGDTAVIWSEELERDYLGWMRPYRCAGRIGRVRFRVPKGTIWSIAQGTHLETANWGIQ